MPEDCRKGNVRELHVNFTSVLEKVMEHIVYLDFNKTFDIVRFS